MLNYSFMAMEYELPSSNVENWEILHNMNYKEDNEKDRIALFKYCLDLNMPEQKKKKVFKYLFMNHNNK